MSPTVDGPVRAGDVVAEAPFDMAGCLARVRQRDEDAARLLLNQLYPLVIKLVRAHLPRRTSEEDLAQAILRFTPPPVSDFNPVVSGAISQVIHKALAKEPFFRFSGVRDSQGFSDSQA